MMICSYLNVLKVDQTKTHCNNPSTLQTYGVHKIKCFEDKDKDIHSDQVNVLGPKVLD